MTFLLSCHLDLHNRIIKKARRSPGSRRALPLSNIKANCKTAFAGRIKYKV